MTNELKQIIDAQDVDRLNNYLILHPGIDLNHATDNGLSALWWAIFPPNNLPSHEIIWYLIEHQVNPWQRVYSQAIYQYVADPLLADTLQQYVAGYVPPLVPPEGELQNIAGDSQNTHNSLIVQQFNEYINRLYQRYVLSKKTDLSWDTQFDDFVSQHNSSPLLQHAIQRIKADKEGYPIEGENVLLSNAALLMLVWHVLNDQDPAHFVSSCSMSAHEQLQRKLSLLNFLIEAQNAYGVDTPACFMGTRHKIISALDKIHVDCESTHQQFTEEKFHEHYELFCAQGISHLQSQNPTLFASFIESYAPTTQDTSAEVCTFIDETKKQFIVDIKQHQLSLPKQYQMQPVQFDKQIELYQCEDTPLSLAQQVVLSKLMRFLSQEVHLRKIGALNKTLPLFPKPDVLETSTIFQQWVHHHYSQDTAAILAYLNTNPLCQEWLSQGKEPEKIAEQLWQEIIRLSLVNREIDLSTEIPSSVILPFFTVHWKKQLEENHLIAWMNSLSNDAKIGFYHALFTQKNQQFSTVAFQYALDHGYWSHFPSQPHLVFEHLDLRGKDFSTLDLSQTTFTHCDLRMTRILRNPTLKSHHLETSLIEVPPQRLGFIAARCNYLAAMQVFLDKYPQYIQNQDAQGNTILDAACVSSKIMLCVLQHCSLDVVFKKNYRDFTPVDIAILLGHKECIDYLLNTYDVVDLCQRDSYGNQILFHFLCKAIKFPAAQQIFQAYLKADEDITLLSNQRFIILTGLADNINQGVNTILQSTRLCMALKTMRKNTQKLNNAAIQSVLALTKSLKCNYFAYLESATAEKKSQAKFQFNQDLHQLLPYVMTCDAFILAIRNLFGIETDIFDFEHIIGSNKALNEFILDLVAEKSYPCTAKILQTYLKGDDLALLTKNNYKIKLLGIQAKYDKPLAKALQLADVCLALKALRLHAQKLGGTYAKNILPLVKSLKENLFTFVEPKTAEEKLEAKLKFNQNLKQLQVHTEGHRELWKPILANLLIAVTGIGLLAITVHYAVTGHHFFAHTKRRELVDDINKKINVFCPS